MDGSTSTSTSPSVKNQGIGRVSDKRNISVSWKIKIQLATANAAATIYQRCHYVWACWASFMALFSEPRRFGSTSFFSTWCPVVTEEDTRRAVARYRSKIWLWVLLDKYRAGLQLLLTQVCEMCVVICQEQKKKWWENVIFTKTNSAVRLSRKPGLDLCCDLLQHLQGIPRTYRFYKIIRTTILLVPSLK